MAKQPPDNVSGCYPLYANKYIQFGSVTPWTGTATDESEAYIKTNLARIDMGIAVIDDTYAIAYGTDANMTSQMLNIERGVVTSGSGVIISRGTSGAASVTVSYILIGDVDTTD